MKIATCNMQQATRVKLTDTGERIPENVVRIGAAASVLTYSVLRTPYSGGFA